MISPHKRLLRRHRAASLGRRRTALPAGDGGACYMLYPPARRMYVIYHNQCTVTVTRSLGPGVTVTASQWP